ncbi:hypothetical protein DPEC_G00028190 [Dallia pectoralis]|uniref:Uncharacterized protein n=1 Tax=Dallia pectoralis TaxID=75939 RepID=A0ACC2HI02_DALPE|nr:hypothetical protein DPEC_G00028190 [Dallia pectoralis]
MVYPSYRNPTLCSIPDQAISCPARAGPHSFSEARLSDNPEPGSPCPVAHGPLASDPLPPGGLRPRSRRTASDPLRRARSHLNHRSIYLFKGEFYWKFPNPGSSPVEGYPRSTATDWLDCPHPSARVPDDLSLSLSPPTGRQERHEWEERGKELTAGRRRGQDRAAEGGLQRVPCTCRNGAAEISMRLTLFSGVLLVTLLAQMTV